VADLVVKSGEEKEKVEASDNDEHHDGEEVAEDAEEDSGTEGIEAVSAAGKMMKPPGEGSIE
jgi:hypothetical protein